MSTQRTEHQTVPEIEIAEGWYVSDLDSPEQCDDALAVLTEAIASIEYQLHAEKFAEVPRGPQWEARARSSLTWRKHARDAVQKKRASIMSNDRLVLAYVRKMAPDLVAEAEAHVEASGRKR